MKKVKGKKFLAYFLAVIMSFSTISTTCVTAAYAEAEPIDLLELTAEVQDGSAVDSVKESIGINQSDIDAEILEIRDASSDEEVTAIEEGKSYVIHVLLEKTGDDAFACAFDSGSSRFVYSGDVKFNDTLVNSDDIEAGNLDDDAFVPSGNEETAEAEYKALYVKASVSLPLAVNSSAPENESQPESASAEEVSQPAAPLMKAAPVLTQTTPPSAGLQDEDPLPGNSGESTAMKFYRTTTSGAYPSQYGGPYHYDVQGVFNGNTIQTCYSNCGYHGVIKVDESTAVMSNENLGQVYTYSNVQVKQNVSLIDNGEVVKFSYTLHNPTDTAKNVDIGNFTDVQIGDNDGAAVYLTNSRQVISMTDTHTGNCASAGLKYTISSDEDTPFTGAWIGGYSSADDNIFFTTTSTENQTVTGTDSGCAFHWAMTLNPGQTVTKTCYFEIAPALIIEAVHLTADAGSGKVKFDIPYKDFANRTQTLFYTLEGMEQKTQAANTNGLTTDAENFAHQAFKFEADATSWPANTMREIILYAVDNVGYKSKTYTFNVWWPEYSNNPNASYYTVAFENTVKNFADVRNEAGKTITLIADDSGDSKKVFDSWNTKADGTGTKYLAGETYTIPAEDSTLYAQWKQDVSVLSFFAEDQVYTGQPVKTVKVKYGTRVLTPDVDYTVTYTNNI